jgi:hypothetical protein
MFSMSFGQFNGHWGRMSHCSEHLVKKAAQLNECCLAAEPLTATRRWSAANAIPSLAKAIRDFAKTRKKVKIKFGVLSTAGLSGI